MGIQNEDEPLTPGGRLFTQPATHQIINCAIGLEQPLEFAAFRTVVSNSPISKHPRFSSLLVTDENGCEYWRKVDVDINRHIIVKPDPVGDYVNDDELAVNDYLAELAVSCPLNTDKPLWELHLLSAHKCLVLRIHHALGDGISVMSLMLTLGRRVDDQEKIPTIEPLVSSKRNINTSGKIGILSLFKKVLNVMKMIWFTLIYMVEFGLRVLVVRDGKTSVKGGEGVEMWPRKIATAKFRIDDMKCVKRAVNNGTINDVLFGVISSGLSKYLDNQSQNTLKEGLQITGVALVNLRPTPGLQDNKRLTKSNEDSCWGNRIGIMLLPVYYHKNGSDALEYLKRAKMMIDRKKLSMEAFLSYKMGYFVMKYFGAKLASLMNYRILCNTSFTISNVVGPKEEFTITGIPVTYLRTTTTSLSHAITMHMVSYAGKADMQILVARDIVPDPENLAKCFEDALLEMKEAVVNV